MKLQASILRTIAAIFLFSGILFFPTKTKAQKKLVTSPEEHFGFQMGADYKLARWDKIVDYFYEVEKQSDRIKVINMGPSAEGHPFLVLIISSPQNLSNLDRLQWINKKITDPRGILEEEMQNYIEEGKAVVFQSMSLHASEVGGVQMTPELTYDLLTRNDTEAQRILDNVLFFMVPSLNPDGQVMITNWYNETVGTEYDGISMPYLYHKYSGHDNNRDGDYMNLQESKYMAKMMFVEWPAQAYIDHHHMGSYGARFYVPPYCDPIRPYADPLVWREISWYGAHIAYKLEEEGFKGILNAAQFAGWGHFGWHWITPFHNIAGMLTESAGVRLATPIYIHPEQLKAGSRMFPEYEAQSTFPNPWEGGWWRLRDIVEQKKSSAWSLLDLAARNKEMVLHTAYLKAKNQTERGVNSDVKTLVIPVTQHDYLTSVKMINTLLRSGIEIQKAKNDFVVKGKIYKQGSYVISLAQPKMGLIRNLLTETHYMDNSWTRQEDGTPIRPYDLATHTMFEFMGVTVDALDTNVEGDFVILKDFDIIKNEIVTANKGYVLDGRQNFSFQAVNLLLDKGIKIYRIDEAFMNYRPGDFLIKKSAATTLQMVSDKIGVEFIPLGDWPSDGIHQVNRGRIALFQRYNGGNMDEGWTRLCFENFSFDYHTLMINEIKEGKLKDKFDVIVIPSDSYTSLTGEYSANSRRIPEKAPEKYKSGIDEEGVKALEEFVESGGTLVAFDASYKFVVDKFGLKVRNILEGLSSNEFFCPGSTIKATFDNTDPLAYGMPDKGLVLFRQSAAFEIIPSKNNADYKTVVRYADKDLLKSGWLIGEKKIAKKSAMISTGYGKGKIVLIGFRTQHRNQTDATFKLLFNTIIE
jgi:hypothetical protein